MFTWVRGCYVSTVLLVPKPFGHTVDSCAERKRPLSGVTSSGRVRRKVPESGARSVWLHCRQASLSGTLSPISSETGYATEAMLVISAHRSTEITLINLMLSTPSVHIHQYIYQCQTFESERRSCLKVEWPSWA